jgi:hypothetical protein
MLTGERGIGKSSLLNYLKYVAEGMIPLDGASVSFLVVDTDVDSNTTQLGLVEKIRLGLDRALGGTEPGRDFLKQTWQFLQRVEGGGFKLREPEPRASSERLLEEFAYSLAAVGERISRHTDSTIFNAKFDGILILVDEADNASATLQLGSFFKLLTERLQRRGCDHVAFGIAGLPELRNVLAASHPE